MIEYRVSVHEDGSTYWRLNGLYHRTDGPAIESVGGYKAWYLNGTQMTEEEYMCEVEEVT